MATIHDVARAAGVSSATVSHVINESRFVSPETRQKVLAAIASLNYRRDGIARSLRRSKTGTIGLVISDITNPFFSDLVRGVEDGVYDQGDNIILCNTDENAAKEKLYIDVLLEKRIDGLILAPMGGNIALLGSLHRGGLPLVLIDRELPEIGADSVIIDNRRAGFELASHLFSLGHRRVTVVRAELQASSINDRIAGFQAAAETAGVPFNVSDIIHSASNFNAATTAGVHLLARNPRPSAIFCTNNFMTLGMINAAADMGLRCPEDIAIVGVDDFPWAHSFRPRLTVVAQPAYEIGREAAQLLLQRLKSSDSPPVRRVLAGHLHIRESCGIKLANQF